MLLTSDEYSLSDRTRALTTPTRRDPWLLNVTNGAIDLRTGELLPYNPDDLLTMMAGTYYEPDATSALWESCLERWFPEPELRSYIQRLAGSFLSGSNLNEILPIATGSGANGKSKYTGALADALGAYAMVMGRDLLHWRKQASHPTNIADLFRHRLATT